jgi:NAD(P)-dependent dehydrogenase (short-subunit alcohol dehydrogenase family)
MTSPRAVVMTGASGTVGQALAEQLTASLPGPIRALGRTPPAGLRRGDRFEHADLSDPDAVTRAARRIAAGPPAAGLVCAAGTDCRAGLADFDPAALAYCLQVNCTAHLQLLQAVSRSRPAPATAIPVVLISSDVIGQQIPATLVYAAAKAAAEEEEEEEEALRHAAADLCDPAITILIVRLPDIGIPMRAAAPGPPPPSRTSTRCQLPVLSAAARAVSRFICDPPAAGLETWHA